MPRATQIISGVSAPSRLVAANDETQPFSLQGGDPNRTGTGQIQIDSDAVSAGGATSTFAVYVKVDSESQWVAEGTTVALTMSAGQRGSVVVQLPKYAYSKVVLVANGDAAVGYNIYYR